MTDTGESAGPNRREFAQVVTLLAAGSFAPAATAGEKKDEIPDAKAHAEAVLTVVRHRFGKLLTDAQLRRVATAAVRGRGRADALKKTPLSNADDPACAFRADLP